MNNHKNLKKGLQIAAIFIVALMIFVPVRRAEEAKLIVSDIKVVDMGNMEMLRDAFVQIGEGEGDWDDNDMTTGTSLSAEVSRKEDMDDTPFDTAIKVTKTGYRDFLLPKERGIVVEEDAEDFGFKSIAARLDQDRDAPGLANTMMSFGLYLMTVGTVIAIVGAKTVIGAIIGVIIISIGALLGAFSKLTCFLMDCVTDLEISGPIFGLIPSGPDTSGSIYRVTAGQNTAANVSSEISGIDIVPGEKRYMNKRELTDHLIKTAVEEGEKTSEIITVTGDGDYPFCDIEAGMSGKNPNNGDDIIGELRNVGESTYVEEGIMIAPGGTYIFTTQPTKCPERIEATHCTQNDGKFTVEVKRLGELPGTIDLEEYDIDPYSEATSEKGEFIANAPNVASLHVPGEGNSWGLPCYTERIEIADEANILNVDVDPITGMSGYYTPTIGYCEMGEIIEGTKNPAGYWEGDQYCCYPGDTIKPREELEEGDIRNLLPEAGIYTADIDGDGEKCGETTRYFSNETDTWTETNTTYCLKDDHFCDDEALNTCIDPTQESPVIGMSEDYYEHEDGLVCRPSERTKNRMMHPCDIVEVGPSRAPVGYICGNPEKRHTCPIGSIYDPINEECALAYDRGLG